MRIANKWSEVSQKQYIEIADINAIDMDVLDKQVKILSILSNTPEDVIIQLEIPTLMKAIRVCNFIYTPPSAGHIKQYIKIGKRKFSVNTQVNKLVGGEYIDYTSMIKTQEELTRNLPKIIAIFLHPVNLFGFKNRKCYEKTVHNTMVQTLESRNKTAKLIESNLMMDNVMMLSGFFLKSYEVLTQATLDYSVLQMKKTRAKLNKLIKEDSESIGVGI